MFHAKDNKQGYIFEQFEYLGPKRLSELKNSWAGIFRIEILPELPRVASQILPQQAWPPKQGNVLDAGLDDPSANA